MPEAEKRRKKKERAEHKEEERYKEITKCNSGKSTKLLLRCSNSLTYTKYIESTLLIVSQYMK